MIVVGALLVVLAALVLAGLVGSAGGHTEAAFFGLILPNLSARTLVLLGLVLGLVAALGVSIIRGRLARTLRRRRARRAAGSRAETAAPDDDDPFLLDR